MGEIVFGVALVLFVAVLIASTYYHDRQKSDNRKKMLRESFGVISDESIGDEN